MSFIIIQEFGFCVPIVVSPVGWVTKLFLLWIINQPMSWTENTSNMVSVLLFIVCVLFQVVEHLFCRNPSVFPFICCYCQLGALNTLWFTNFATCWNPITVFVFICWWTNIFHVGKKPAKKQEGFAKMGQKYQIDERKWIFRRIFRSFFRLFWKIFWNS